MAAVFLACCIAPARAWAAPLQEVYVSAQGSDETGDGSVEKPFGSIARAIDEEGNYESSVADGGTVHLLTPVTMQEAVRVYDKSVTIDGNGNTITRGKGIGTKHESARDYYNPALFEIGKRDPQSDGEHSLTFVDVTLDDAGIHEGTIYQEQYTQEGTTGANVNMVQDAMIASYSADCSIVLKNDVKLVNYGGMSAVRVQGASVEVGPRCQIFDNDGTAVEGFDRSGVTASGAIWVQGGSLTLDSEASIHDIVGRAVLVSTGGTADIFGSISNVGGAFNPDGGQQPTEGLAVLSTGKGSLARIYGSISNVDPALSISNYSAQSTASALRATGGSSIVMEKGSSLSAVRNCSAIYAQGEGASVRIDGTVRDCVYTHSSHGAVVRASFGAELTLGPTGLITDCEGTSGIAVLYSMSNKSVVIEGSITENRGRAVYMHSSNIVIRGSAAGTAQEGEDAPHGNITNNTGDGLRVTQGTTCTIENGTVSSNGGYGVRVDKGSSKLTVTGESEIVDNGTYGVSYSADGGSWVKLQGGTIEGNEAEHQVLVSGGSANDTDQHAEIAKGIIDSSEMIGVAGYSLILDDAYEDVQVGQAGDAAKTAITNGLASGYTANGGALWIKPSTAAYHFQMSNPDPTNKHSLYVAYVELDTSGNPVTDASVVTHEVKNAEIVDVTLQNAEAGKPCAVMLVNAGEYSLYADDVTIYTGGGKGSENYDGGFPKVTFTGCLPEISSIEVGGLNITPAEGYTYADQLLEYLDVSYVNEDGVTATSDAEPGEYKIELSWNDKLESVKINDNDVSISDELFGTLIVRYVANEDEAISGDSTHELLDTAPTGAVKHAEAVAKGTDPKFFTNNDESREVDAKGVQILDDDLLTELGDNRQQALEEKAAERLGAPAEGKQWSYEFRYLDLVDAHNGNAWVSASEGTTVYLPYHEGVTKDTAGLTVLHFPGLHREYGIAGQADVAAAVAACEPETVSATFGEDYISFEVGRSGFSPFAVAWQSDGPVGPGPNPGGGDDDDERPAPDDTGVSDWLDTEDHRAYLSGYGDGSGLFGVDEPMTRAEAATMFHNLLLDKSVGGLDADFPDLREGAYYVDAVRTLASRGIIMGNGDGTFAPDRPITRAEFVAIAMRFTDSDQSGANPFSDVEEGSWYYGPVVGSARFGWVSGYVDGTFGPDDTLTRGQATAIVNHMLGRAADEAWAEAHMGQVKTFPDVYEGHFAYGEVLEATNSHDYEWEDGVESWTGLRR